METRVALLLSRDFDALDDAEVRMFERLRAGKGLGLPYVDGGPGVPCVPKKEEKREPVAKLAPIEKEYAPPSREEADAIAWLVRFADKLSPHDADFIDMIADAQQLYREDRRRLRLILSRGIKTRKVG